MDNLANRIANLSPEQLAQLTQKLHKQREGQLTPLQPRTTNTFPLSFAQQRLWLLHQFHPESPFYNLPAQVRITGPLDVSVLEQSLTALCDRHEPLRTVFGLNATGEPVQIVQPIQPQTLTCIDLQVAPNWQQQVDQYAIAIAKEPFDLTQGPLVRILLLQLEPDTYILCLCLHHIIADGWALGIFVQELTALYDAFKANRPSPLPSLKIQYVDYAVWQRQESQADKGDRHLQYWQQQLQGVPTVLELPTDYPRPPVQSMNGARHPIHLNRSLTQALKNLGQTEEATLFMTVLAAFKVLLYRCTNQSDLLVGTPVANRDRVATEQLIGVFVNTLALRTQLQGDWSFRELIQQVREVVIEANTHQDLPFEKLVEVLHPERSRSYAPLLQVMLTIQNWLPETYTCGELTLKPEPIFTGTIQFDLVLELVESADGLQGWLKYNTDIFSAATIQRMVDRLEVILERSVAAPKCPIAQIPLLTPLEQQQLLIGWNRTAIDYPSDQCIHQLFERQVEQTPDAIAVEFEEKQYTYQQLNHRANQLAHYLQGLGVKPETLVGICVERSLEMVVGLLAILKAGGAYVPMDPSYPRERLVYMFNDSQVSVLLTQQQLKAKLPACQGQIVCFDTEKVSHQSIDNPVRGATTSNLAYVIYTSGSTGKPKGVLVAHQGLSNLVQAQKRLFDVQPKSRVLQFASLSFDASIWEIVMALGSGASLHLARPDALLPGPGLMQLLQEQAITHATLPPSALAAMQPETLPVQVIIVAGEACPPELVAKWSVGQRFFNAYGPTEATVCATVAECTDSSKRLPIGRPIANTQVYLLDSHLQPVPIGVPGELHISGVGLARGYLNRPELTAERFISNPFGPGRLYKTGDLARYRPDGNLEFLGRIDRQVKLRGFRIELGEVEMAIARQPAVKQCVVLVQEDPFGNQQLLAYAVMDAQKTNADVSEVKRALKGELPEYMVPNIIVSLEALPLTPSGKVDRKALPAPSAADLMAGRTDVAPQSERQRLIAQQFAQTLSLPPEQVGLHANFFDLGGHSLLATQLGSRLQQIFEVEVPLRVLFESPTVAELDEALKTLEGNHSATSLAVPAIVPLPSAERDLCALPLSFAQQRLWFLAQLEGSSATYNIPGALRIEGPFDIAALQQALDTLVARHESLRTCFPIHDDIAVQCIAPQLRLPLVVIEAAELDRPLPDWLSHQAQLPFDLETGPLLRVQLVQMTPSQAVLLVVMHHIISDGWSMGIFIQEISALYQSYRAGQPSELPPLPIQYTDYSAWQRQWLNGEVLKQQICYWQRQLAEAPALLELPTDRPRPAVQSFQGRTYQVTLPADLIGAVKTLAQQQRVTLFMVLLAAFQLLLSRYSTQRDIVVGTPIANRQRPELESLIGFFVNTLALRTTIDETATIADLLQQVRRTALEAYANQDVPFEQVVEALSCQRTLARSPLFQVMFIVQNAPTAPLELDGVFLTPLEVKTDAAKFDLTLSMQETAQGLVGSWEYNSDLFEVDTIARMATHFETLLRAMADVQQSVATLPLLAPLERQQLLVDWNDTAVDYPSECIHELFEQQAARTPEAIAAVFGAESLSYEALNNRANQLACTLQHLGVGPETLVGLCVERSLDMLVGLLGILKAGGAYVPLDPSYPKQRLQFMLEDAQVPILITQQSVAADLPAHQAQQICLDADWALIQSHDIINPVSRVEPENLAYIIYTSGSTGKPKGVQISHRAVVNFLQAQAQLLGMTAQDTFLAVTSICFDIAVLELFLPLTVGSQVVVASREVAREGFRLAEQLDAVGATFMQATPSTWRMLLVAHWAGKPGLKILCGGEALPPDLAVALQSRCATLWNLYGPTETTIWSAQQEIVESEAIAVGTPIANTQIHLLDPDLNLVPVGVPGEVYIGGLGLARGYYQRRGLTAERFVPHPFGTAAGERLYRTGDLGRYRTDGTIEILGRMDRQVKIRGFRVELDEIETVLSCHKLVQQCAVTIREDIPSNRRLVAYVVSNEEIDREDLKAYLKQHLLDYMVPNTFVFLQALPLTPNGKLDRAALPIPSDDLIATSVAPSTPNQVTLAKLFAEILTVSVEQIGIHDSFFELGGHSLSATQVSAQVRRVFRVEMPLRQLFETPTIADLATWLADQRPAAENAAPIPQMSREQVIPLSFAQERIWFIDQFDPGNVAYNLSAAVHLTGKVDIAALQQSLQAIVERHEILRTTFPLEQGQPVQQIAPALAVTLPLIDLQSLTPEQHQTEVQRLAIALAQQPFDLAQSPLFRALLLCLGDRDYVLLWSMHHIISDGWSMGVLVRELAALYTARITDSPSPLKALPIQYADFALWQRQWLAGELEQQLAYWRQKLGGKLPVLRLPTDYPPPAIPSFRGATATLELSADLVGRLQALSQEVGGTLFMTLLAGFKTLLYAYTGQHDLVVGTDIANRNQAEVEDLIGFFVNLLVLRTDLSGNPKFRDAIQRVRETSLEAYACQDLPFAQLVQALPTETSGEALRRGTTTPLFQVLFVLQNVPLQPLKLPDVTLTPLNLPSGSAKFDLALFLYETAAGMTIAWNYSIDRFAAATIDRMAHQFETLLQQIVNQPDSSLESLANLVAPQPSSALPRRRKSFKRLAPQAVRRSATDVVASKVLPCGVLSIQPRHETVDLASWAASQQSAIYQQLHQRGALLFRGFSIRTATAFEQVAQAISPELFSDYGDLPRTSVSGKVYDSTPYPEDRAILFHNESSHLQQWPMKIWFCCLQPAQQGGATPIVDCRRVYQALSAEVRDRLLQKQLLYVRNYIKGLDVSWQDFFQTTDRAVVEQRCRATGMDWEWLEADNLQTRQVRPAIVRHPQTGEWVVFNQLQLHHLSYLDAPTQASLQSLFKEERLPRQVYYGDGSPIEPAVLEMLQAAYTEAEQVFSWQQGDILMLDNMLTAHGRQTYVGPRKIAVAMAEIMTQVELDAQWQP